MDINLFDKIAGKLVEIETISIEDKKLYEYGLKQIASTLANVATTLIIGFIFGMVWESILFMVSYIPLRSYAGGYHARTPLRCYIFSVILTVGVLLTVRYMPHDMILVGALILISGILLFVFAPIGDENKPLDEVEIKVFKRRARLVLIIQFILIGVIWVSGLIWIAVCVAVSITVASLMVMISVITKALFKNKKSR